MSRGSHGQKVWSLSTLRGIYAALMAYGKRCQVSIRVWTKDLRGISDRTVDPHLYNRSASADDNPAVCIQIFSGSDRLPDAIERLRPTTARKKP
jgi:hypothetical protein